MPNNDDVSTGELCRKINEIKKTLNIVVEEQNNQGTQLAVMNNHLDNLNGNVEQNCEEIDTLKEHQRKIIGVGVLAAFVIPLIIVLILELI